MITKSKQTHFRDALVRHCFAFSALAGLLTCSADALTASATFKLGAEGSGTTIGSQAVLTPAWIPAGTLPVGSFLKTVSINARLDTEGGGDTFASDLFVYVDPGAPPSGGELLQVGGFDALGAPASLVGWANGDTGALGTTSIDSKEAPASFPATIDLNGANVYLGSRGLVSGSWSGTVTVEYEVFEPGAITSFGPGAEIGELAGNAAAITWVVPPGTDVTALSPTFTLSSGTSDKDSGGPTTYDFTNPVIYTVTDGATVNTYTVTVAIADFLRWNVAGDGDWDTTTANWLAQPTATVSTFANGNEVVFDNAAGGVITIPTTVFPGSTTIGAAAGDYTFTGEPLAGTGALTMEGAGTLTLNNPNTYSGSTVVNGGTLVANGTGAVGGSTSFAVADGAELVLAGSIASKKTWPENAAPLSGAGIVTLPATGFLGVGFKFDMSAFTGELKLNGGQFSVNPFFSPGFVSPVNGTITVENGTTLYLGWQGFVLDTTVILNGSVDNGENLGVLRGDTATLNGAVILATDSTIGNAGGTFTINAAISDGGSGFGFAKVANGTVVLTGTNTYTGLTTVAAGALQCDSSDAVASGDFSIAAGGAKLNLNYTGTKAITSLTLGGVSQVSGTYGSTASDATFKNDTYFVGTGTVTVPASAQKNFLTFSFGGIGPVSIGEDTVTLLVPFGTDPTNLAPTYTVSPGASGSPASGTTVNFTSPQTYTITAEDLSTKPYTVTVVVGSALLWNVAGGGDWDFSSSNWFKQSFGTTSNFTNGDQVIFNNPAGGTVNITEPMSPQSTTIGPDAGDYLFSGSPLAGIGSLTMGAAGTLTLDSPNTYSGSTIVNNGTLVANGTDSLGVSTSFTVADGAELVLAGATAEKNIWPENAATLTGAGKVSVSANTSVKFNFDMSAFTGELSLSGTQFPVSPFFSPAFVSPVNGMITLGNATSLYLGFTGYVMDTTVKLDSGIDNGEGLGVLRGDTATLNGAVILATDSTIGSAGGTFTVNAAISDGGSGFGFTKVALGTVVLTGNNTYGGSTTVAAGTLQCDSADSLGSGDLRITSGVLNLNYAGTRTVASLALGGVDQTVAGTYGSPESGADFPSAFFIGTGTVTISSVGSAYDAWAAGSFLGTLTDPTPNSDFDGGGLDTAIEWVVGGDPTNPGDDATLTPTVATDGTYLIFTYLRTNAANDDPNTAIKVEYNTDLQGTWTEAQNAVDGVVIEETPGSPADTVVVKIPKSVASPEAKLFARLRVDVTLP